MVRWLQRLWTACTVVSCALAFFYVMRGNGASAITTALMGVVFFLMSNWHHDELDGL